MEALGIIDTSKVQLASLKVFMTTLGYEYYGIDKVFISERWVNRSRLVICFRTAALAHNHTERGAVFADVPVELWERSHQRKLVHNIYLQHSRKKGILCTKHLVKFVNPANASLLLKRK